MKIYTYYEDFGFNNQLELIELWKQSWSKNGYDPVVLGEKDVETHGLYNNFCTVIKNIHKSIIGEEISAYGLSCFVRWLAYSNLNLHDRFYVSDYDIINKNYPVIYPIDRLHLMDGHCPCIASGNSNDFQKLCHMFINVTLSNLEEIKIRNTSPHYHDQEFFSYNNKTLQQEKKLYITRSRPTIGEFYTYEDSHPDIKIFHVAHRNVFYMRKKKPELFDPEQNDDVARLEMVKSIIDE